MLVLPSFSVSCGYLMKINYIQIRAPNSHTFKLHAAKPTIHEHFQRKNLHSVNGLICKFSSVTVKIHTFSIFLYTLHLFSCCFFTLSCLLDCLLPHVDLFSLLLADLFVSSCLSYVCVYAQESQNMLKRFSFHC